MKRTIKKYFIPHEDNSYHPHMLHTKRAVGYSCIAIGIKVMVFLFALVIPAPAFVSPDVLAVEEQQIIAKTNALRKSQQIPTVQEQAKLNYSAQLKTQDMADHQLFSHTASNGQGLAYFLAQAGYEYRVAGENLAMGYSNVDQLMNAWEQSPTHYSNLVDTDYEQIGIGIVGGVYNDIPTIYVTQHFGTPKEEKQETVVVSAIVPEVEPSPVITNTTSSSSSSPAVLPPENNITVVSQIALASTTPQEVIVAAHQVESETIQEEPTSPLTLTKSSLQWEEQKGKTIITASVQVSEPVLTVQAQVQDHFFDLSQQGNGEYLGTYTIDQPAKKVFGVIFPAQVTVVSQEGEEHIFSLQWETIPIIGPTAVERYTIAKQRLAPTMGFFLFSDFMYMGMFLFFLSALLINIVIEWRLQHHSVIAQSCALLAVIALFYFL